MTTKYLPIGTISHATMRAQDLIPRFLDALEEVDRERAGELRAEVPADAWGDDDHEWWNSEDASYLLNDDIWEAMQAHCPEYCYFGSTYGDGSDYGVWLDWDAVKMGLYDGELVKADDLADVPEDWSGPVLVVNDHGNTSYYGRGENGDLACLWAVV